MLRSVPSSTRPSSHDAIESGHRPASVSTRTYAKLPTVAYARNTTSRVAGDARANRHQRPEAGHHVRRRQRRAAEPIEGSREEEQPPLRPLAASAGGTRTSQGGPTAEAQQRGSIAPERPGERPLAERGRYGTADDEQRERRSRRSGEPQVGEAHGGWREDLAHDGPVAGGDAEDQRNAERRQQCDESLGEARAGEHDCRRDRRAFNGMRLDCGFGALAGVRAVRPPGRSARGDVCRS